MIIFRNIEFQALHRPQHKCLPLVIWKTVGGLIDTIRNTEIYLFHIKAKFHID